MTLLTIDDLRLFPSFASSAIEDEGLQILLDAAEAAIDREMGGPVGTATEVVGGGLYLITLRQRAVSITSIDEKTDSVSTTLAEDDWLLRYDRRTLERLGDGTNAAGRWGTRSTIVYEPENDEAERKRVQLALVELDANYAPGMTGEQIGSWMEQHQQSSNWNYETERAAILASLWSPGEVDFA